ncbi:MAG: alkaline phosphatase [Ignavibacteriales bacterium CG12_big_fil_rev_8_21_14_0_65_30_8]|nr:MAG: alkaline phosphatase [Ignavibacteriales bacterium CG12_big_fil_rev_8_21_14_0_65_30_8]
MNRIILLLIFTLISNFLLTAQNKKAFPKLVVGIVVDQMRFDYLYRFNPLYGENGFKKLMKDGSNFTFAHFNYIPTYTGPGHASIYTGTTPYYHGIISNSWFDKKTKKTIYCTSDKNYKTIGADNDNGEMSPKQLLSTTITDQLKMATNNKGKVISVSIKDRAAILPGGHRPDGAYWYDSKSGNFITSSFYMNDLPNWVKEFNSKKLPDKYMSTQWDLSYPLEKYWLNFPDERNFEEDLFLEKRTSFPHTFKFIPEKEKKELLKSTPYGNELLYNLAVSALTNENLGKDEITDFLAISFSSTDYIGHNYGPNSVEIEDTYVKLDLLVAKLINELNKNIGEGNYILFLTADHGVAENPEYLWEHNIKGNWINFKMISDSLYEYSEKNYGANVIEKVSNKQIFLKYDLIKSLKLDLSNVRKSFSEYLINAFPFIAQTTTRDNLTQFVASRSSSNLILNGFSPLRSGDVVLELQPGYIPGSSKDRYVTHGSSYPYDTHVPLLFYGWNIPSQTINTPVYTIDIAATISDLLQITEPSGNMGIPLISHIK